MSIFGWDYPPGCSSTPYDEDYPCEVCCKLEDDCECPECPECGDVGNPNCFRNHGLVDPCPIKHPLGLYEAIIGPCKDIGEAEAIEKIKRAIYKGTNCGAWFYMLPYGEEHWMGGVVVGSIVEGVEQTTKEHAIWFPFHPDDFWFAVQEVEDEAHEIWMDTHGCEDCWPDGYQDECGPVEYPEWPVNPDCRFCDGGGAVI